MTDTPLDATIAALCGQVVILDTQGPLLYIGTLTQVGRRFLVLLDADVHDRHDSPASKELYIQQTAELGVRVNRSRVIVMRREVASVSLLSEVRVG
ncbi:MAG: hypothetical protein FWD61_16070 [Phycisphaerales bacterium]|nr:hypothetical protein [Phycisphaerales bacterium]